MPDLRNMSLVYAFMVSGQYVSRQFLRLRIVDAESILKTFSTAECVQSRYKVFRKTHCQRQITANLAREPFRHLIALKSIPWS
jgi:hypothetical protein